MRWCNTTAVRAVPKNGHINFSVNHIVKSVLFRTEVLSSFLLYHNEQDAKETGDEATVDLETEG